MTSVAELLGNKVCSALMSLHCLTGKYEGHSYARWAYNVQDIS